MYLYMFTPLYLISLISDIRIYIVLNIISELLNPFKLQYPLVYSIKVCIDIPKELIKLSLMCK